MNELTTTRHNLLTDPMVHVWDWQIPVYLFLGGLVAGMMIITGYFLFSGRSKGANCACKIVPLLGLIAISIGMFALFLDLEHKLYVWRLYTTFKPMSPMSWGAWVLLIVYPVLIATYLIGQPGSIAGLIPGVKKATDYMTRNPARVKLIGVISMLTGGVLGIYTGVLLSTLGARPLWNSSMLWLLFLLSGLSSAAALVHMIAKQDDEKKLLAKADNGFIILEIFVIALLLIGLLTSSEPGIEAGKLLLSGPFAAVFWVFVIGIGLIIPLIIQLNAVNHKIRHTALAPVMVILGGLALRFIIVAAGQFSHL